MREGGGEGEGDPHRRDAADPAEVGGGVCGGAREESREGGVESRWGGVARGIADNAGRRRGVADMASRSRCDLLEARPSPPDSLKDSG